MSVQHNDIATIDALNLSGRVTAVAGDEVTVDPFGPMPRVTVYAHLVRPAGFPCWSGTYTLTPSLGHVIMRRRLFGTEPVAVYDYQANVDNPLTLWTSPTTFLRPYNHFDACDFGSVPSILQGAVSPTCAPRTFILHDSTFEFQSWWTEDGLQRVTRRQADGMVYAAMRAEGCSMWLARKASIGLRAGSWAVWDDDKITPENEQRAASAKTM